MKKKLEKKLVLAKETVIRLTDPLGEVAGAFTGQDWCFSGFRTCATCAATCTTNLC